MKSLTPLLSDILRLPEGALIYELSVRLAHRIEGLAALETEDSDFDPVAYARAGHCALFVLEDTHPQLDAEWRGAEKGVRLGLRNALAEVQWRGRRLYVLKVTVDDGCTTRYVILAETPALAQEFFAAVCRWSDLADDTILVYRQGYWQRDNDLRASIAAATLDSLVLPGELKERLVEDVEGFFGAREEYERYGVAWKRGVLLLGPPGNGKTHAIKALIARMKGVACLYVRSLKAHRKTTHDGVQEVFRRARNSAPCLLILEDLDSLVDKETLSYFLNEMDGFATNRGILTLATTNHPERLDAALLERPSRFDRKVTFPLPAEEERRRFLSQTNARWEPEMRASEDDLAATAAETEGFSFAYLKELTISAMVAWMRERRPGAMGPMLRDLVEPLRAQMRTSPAMVDEEGDED